MREWLNEEYGEFWIGGWLVDGIEALGAGLMIAPWCLLVGLALVWVGLPVVWALVLSGLLSGGAIGWAFVALVREDCAMRAIVRAGREPRS